MRWPADCTTASSLARHYRSLLRSCARRSSLQAGQTLHAAAVTAGLLSLPQLYLANAVLHMYAACGQLPSARRVFDRIPISHKDAADWTALMDCHARDGSPADALRLFAGMRRIGVPIDGVAMVSPFSTCAKIGNSSFGIQCHGFMVKSGLGSAVKARNSAIDMYVKCGLMSHAKSLFTETNLRTIVSWTVLLWGVAKWEGLQSANNLFDQMPERNEIAWTIIIARHIENGLTREAFGLLSEMIFGLGLQLNSSSSLCSLLSACTQSGDSLFGKWVHSYAIKSNFDIPTEVKLGTTLLDMYAKCGRIQTAVRVFNSMKTRNIVTWNAILSGLAMHGKGPTVLSMFDKMSREAKPNDITFTAVLTACSHSGLVETGREFFRALEKPTMENYACFVDLLARSGNLAEAESIIREMPMKPNEVVLGALLSASSAQNQHELVQELAQVHPENTDHHVLVANMYARSGDLGRANFFRKDLRERGIRKVPGISTIYINGQAHHFSAGDKLHSRINEIYSMLDEMIMELKLAGYVPDPTAQILSGSGEERELAVLFHGEKLALCFGLMSTKAGRRLYIFKNLRICRDCHSAMKVASRVYVREIVVRDRNRFHSFKDGVCSCSDYW
ncbi:pentatricopeptide repeat-containing family protein [Striga asiatica]|uniref:Pentatricopeptide repeat-containing family protein n=1 Tax=Striga asiatica TaxID=4170 RepID=A0A5A7QJ21_STRAF|nr:pentatricopeptide repeat-containing family protein [Striga asiatica]